jgi:hypothetical protein
MQYENMNIVLRTDGRRREEERERESERYLSIYSMGDYLNVGCHLTSPTILDSLTQSKAAQGGAEQL